MKKILVLFLIIICCVPTALAKGEKTTATEKQNSGYVGTLPNIDEQKDLPSQQETKPSFEYKDGFNDPDEIKPAPRDNPAFINIIMKKDKTSQYVNDLNSLITIIEKLQDIIENENDVQKFNAEAYYLKTNVEYFRDKYRNQAEESYVSYQKVMQLNTHVQSVAQLRLDSEANSPYVTEAQSGNMFSQNNIDNQLNYLQTDIEKALVILKDTK